MSTRRIRPDAGFINGAKRDDQGRPVCRWCGGLITAKGRRTFCSDACVHEWKLRTNPGYVRAKVFERDRGVCPGCAADCRRPDPYGRQHVERMGPWQADHIVPVVEGGGECGLEGYRTLCIPCHKLVTRELHRRLKEKRTGQPSLPGVIA